MSSLVRQSSGAGVAFGARLGGGGEGEIYTLSSDSALVAKVYHAATPDQRKKLPALMAKLRVMIANPPADPMAEKGHVSIAWPVELLLDARQNPVGYLMPRAPHDRKLFTYYNTQLRLRASPLFQHQYLLATAANIASAAASLHDAGYVIGDVNESNILAGDTALVTLVDTDSFQVPDRRSGSLYRCTVGKPEYTPPELQGKSFDQVDRSPQHDAFGLAVLLFQLLMEGVHPFDGVYTRAGEPPPREECIANGYFAFGPRRPGFFRPIPSAVPLDTMTPAIRGLFLRCFEEGHRNPAARPAAREWREALNHARLGLTQCRENTQHWYGNHLSQCPWCERKALLRGIDPFPSREAVRTGQHTKTPARPAAPAPRPAVVNRPPPPPPVPQAAPWVGPAARLWLRARRLPRAVYGWAVVALLLVVAAAYGLFRTGPGGPDTSSAGSSAAPAALPVPANLRTQVNPADGLTYVFVPPGKFTMGCSPGDTECDSDEKPPHAEEIATGFWLSQTEVTQAAWKKVMKGDNPSQFKGDDLPVETIDWNQASAYCKAAGGRLPSEKEWEYAARGGTTGARDGDINAVAWFSGNSGNKTHPVGTKQANAYGLFDMLGNVWEWTSDNYNSTTMKVLRGGSWVDDSRLSRASNRSRYGPAYRNDGGGVRCVGELR